MYVLKLSVFPMIWPVEDYSYAPVLFVSIIMLVMVLLFYMDEILAIYNECETIHGKPRVYHRRAHTW